MNEKDIELVGQPIPNMDKIYAVLDQIEADPEHWDQKQWAVAGECGTTMCFAGWACKMEGLELLVETDNVIEYGPYCPYLADEEKTLIPDAAQEILGLTVEERDNLFIGTLYTNYSGSYETNEQRRARQLLNVKVEVAKISARAKEQRAAFERVAKELIDSVPELEAVLKPDYLCPESQELVMKHLGGQDGGH